MSAGFLIKEGFSGLTRARFPSFAAILTIAIALTLLGSGYVAGTEIYHVVEQIRSRFQVEVFLLPDASKQDKSALENHLNSLESVDRYSFVSRMKAAERFKKEFGEDVIEALGSNPLPESYIIQLKDGYRTYSAITHLEENVSNLAGVDEVEYQSGFLQGLERYIRVALIAGGVLLILVLTAAILLVGNTIKLSIFAKRDIIRIMRLVGATNRFIRIPFLIEGILQGILGAVLSSGLLYILIQGTDFLLRGLYSISLDMDYALLAGILVAGILFGLIGSMRSIRLFLNRKHVI